MKTSNIKILMAFSIAVLGVFLCCSQPSKGNTKIKQIKLIVQYPILINKTPGGTDIQLTYLRDSVGITYLNEFILYRIPETRNFETGNLIGGTESWFIFKKGSMKGGFFNAGGDSNSAKFLPVDSFLKARAYLGANFDTGPGVTLVRTVSDPYGIVSEVYSSNAGNGANAPDSFFFYFSKTMADLDYSIGQRLDSLKKAKLFKARLLYNERSEGGGVLPKREFKIEIERDSTIDESKIQGLIKMYDFFKSKLGAQ